MEDNVLQVNIDDIIPNRFQPRLSFDEQGLKELAASIKEHGIIQPLVLRKLGSKYEIIAGERRYKASIMAGLTTVPAVISNIDDNSSAEIALVENIQRRNLTPIEEARSYKNLLDKGYTQEQLAQKMGISQSSVANKLRLLNLDDEVQQALLEGKISERHARSLLVLNDPEKEKEWLTRIITERLTVRQLDQELKKLKDDSKKSEIPLVDINPNIDSIKSNATEINKKNIPTMEDDILKDYSNDTSESSLNSVKIIDALDEPVDNSSESLNEAMLNNDTLGNFESLKKPVLYETLEPISDDEKKKVNNSNKGYFSFDFLQPDNVKSSPATKKDIEVLPSDTKSDLGMIPNANTFDSSTQTPLDNTLFSEQVSPLNPNNKFFTPPSTNEFTANEPESSSSDELFDPMSLLNGLTNDEAPTEKSVKDLTSAKESLQSVISELRRQGFNVKYNETNSADGYQITINVN